MLNVYLFIELLGGSDPANTIAQLRELQLGACRVVHAVKLNEEKIVGQIDCKTLDDANAAILHDISRTSGVVQTNIIAVVKPRN